MVQHGRKLIPALYDLNLHVHVFSNFYIEPLYTAKLHVLLLDEKTVVYVMWVCILTSH